MLEAFERAFPDGKENVGITLHSNGLVDRYSYIQKDIREASASDPRINVSERSLSHHDMLSLIRASDAYVSLHRSEGFGMAMAEAMAFGRIATRPPRAEYLPAHIPVTETENDSARKNSNT